jgi:hypothetical protein
MEKFLNWLFTQKKETVYLFALAGVGIWIVRYEQPRHFALINAGYVDVYERLAAMSKVRDDKIQEELIRLNKTLEARDAQQQKLVDYLIDQKEGRK